MPELPEVETVMRGLEPVLVGDHFQSVELRRPDLRFPFPKDFIRRLQGQPINRLERRSKYLLGHLGSGEILAMHLGMSGRFTIDQHSQGSASGDSVHRHEGNPAHNHVIFHMSKGAVITYNDARRFGFMTLVEKNKLNVHKLFQALGVEPLGRDLTPLYIAGRAMGRMVSIKSFLMDQKVIAGLGNIYVCEALFRARLSPVVETGRLATRKGAASSSAKRLVSAIQSVLQDAIEAGGSSLKDHRKTDGSLGYFQHAFAVYGRAGEDCMRSGCSGTVQRIIQSGRSTFYCPGCQR